MLAAVAAAILLGGIGATVYLIRDDDPAPRRAAPATTVPGTDPTPTTTGVSTGDEPGYITDIKEQVSKIRGLPWKSALKVDIVSKDELSQRVRDVVARDAHPDRMAGDEATLKLLDAIPDDLNYTKAIDDLLAEQVLGFYDPETKDLVVADAGDGEVSASTKVSIAHELVHALTDQHFDFGGATDVLDERDLQEELFAYSGLIEGDAVTLQFAWAQEYLSEEEQVEILFGGIEGGDTSVLERTPEFMQESLLFPYIQGPKFVAALGGDGFESVNDAYRRPPTSTEQILHPETYRAGEASAPPELPDVAAAAGCETVRRNTIGEFAMAEILGEEISEADAAGAAEGWNGDVFHTVRCEGSLAMVERWSADDEAAAMGLEQALRRWAAEGSPESFRLVSRNGSKVQLVVSDDMATSQRLEAAVGPLN